MTYHFRTSDWFAGFADGEATFYLSPNGAPTFQLCLRADDQEILEALCGEFGGSLRTRVGRVSKPSVTWTVRRRDDLPALLEYFDAHPLRAKKARDYAVWRLAVLAYVEGGAKAARRFKQQLNEARKYDGPVLPFVQRPVGRPRAA